MKEISKMHDEDAHDDNLKLSTTPLLPTILLPRATSVNTASVAPPCVEYDEAGFDIHANLAGYTELEIAKALARHSVEIGLPKHYAPNHLVPEGKMRVVAVKAQKISSQKAVLIVRFISPPSLRTCIYNCSVPASNQTPNKVKVPT